MKSSIETEDRDAGKGRSFWPVIIKVMIDVVIPVAGYYALRAAGVAQLTALVLTSVPAVAFFLYRIVRGRRVDAFEVFVLAIVAASNAASFASGDPRLFLSMDGWVSLSIAAACFISLSTRRPLVYLLLRSLLDDTPLRRKLRTAQWEEAYERDRWFRRPWVFSTKVWGALSVVTGTVRLGIAFLLPVDLAPLLLGLMSLEIVVFLQVWQTWYLRGYFRRGRGFLPEQDKPETVGTIVYRHRSRPEPVSVD
jgi:hypothetical protein